VHFVGLFLSSSLKMHGPKNKIEFTYFYSKPSAFTQLLSMLVSYVKQMVLNRNT